MKYLDRWFTYGAAYAAYNRRWKHRDTHWRIPGDREAIEALGYTLAYEVPLAELRRRFAV